MHDQFKEIQYFPRWISIGLFILSLILFYLVIDNYDNEAFLPLLLGGLIPDLLILALLVSSKLNTRINDEGIGVLFFPFQRKEKLFAWKDIIKCEVISYSPIKDYGGWGIRYGRKGKAYIVSGSKGIQLDLSNGKHLLIGTHKETQAKRVLKKYNENRSSSL